MDDDDSRMKRIIIAFSPGPVPAVGLHRLGTTVDHSVTPSKHEGANVQVQNLDGLVATVYWSADEMAVPRRYGDHAAAILA
jgi:hypothetical protein